MKISLTFLFFMSVNMVFGQTNVRKTSEVPEKEWINLTNKYASDFFDQKNNALLYSYTDSAVNAVFPKVPSPGFVISFHAMVSKEGRVDHLLFQATFDSKSNGDSLSTKLKEALIAQVSQYKSVVPGKSFTWNFHRMIGKFKTPREVRKADSSLSNVKDAIAFVDTLGIKRLFFHELELKDVPAVIYRFPHLEELYLGKNELKEAEIDLKRLPRLTQLHLQGNQLTKESLKITRNKNLSLLNLNENKMTDIPQAAKNCKRLDILWLGGNDLNQLSGSGFKGLRRVKDLNLYKTNIAAVPTGIKKMKRLVVLDLYHNKLTEVNPAVCKLKRLTHLAVSHNELTSLPEKIFKLKKIHTLYAHHNRLSKLPGKITQLEQMKILDLGYNWFTDFPAQITAFTKLEELDLSANNFHEFPGQLLLIPHLDKLYLRGNPFLESSAEVKYASQLGNLKNKNIEVFY